MGVAGARTFWRKDDPRDPLVVRQSGEARQLPRPSPSPECDQMDEPEAMSG